MVYLWKNRSVIDIIVKEFNFSEVQLGKDICDVRIGSCRLYIFNYINEGYDVIDVFQMKNVLESYGGVVNIYVLIIDVFMEKQLKLLGQLKGCFIIQFNNFIFEEDGLRIFKVYGFGEERILIESLNVIFKYMLEICGYQVI